MILSSSELPGQLGSAVTESLGYLIGQLRWESTKPQGHQGAIGAIGTIGARGRKHCLSTEQFPVSAYTGSSKNLKNLKGDSPELGLEVLHHLASRV